MLFSSALFLKKTFGLEERKNLSQRWFAQLGILYGGQKILVLNQRETATDQGTYRGPGIEGF
jgi:hypothetical protein